VGGGNIAVRDLTDAERRYVWQQAFHAADAEPQEPAYYRPQIQGAREFGHSTEQFLSVVAGWELRRLVQETFVVDVTEAGEAPAFHCAYSSGRHTAHGRYLAATAVCLSVKNARFLDVSAARDGPRRGRAVFRALHELPPRSAPAPGLPRRIVALYHFTPWRTATSLPVQRRRSPS
jgi:hypothetical protein